MSASTSMGSTEAFIAKAHKVTDFRNQVITSHTQSVPCAPMADILVRSGMTAATVFTLDVEGQEHRVLQTINWARFSFGVLIIELPCAPHPRSLSEMASARASNSAPSFLLVCTLHSQ